MYMCTLRRACVYVWASVHTQATCMNILEYTSTDDMKGCGVGGGHLTPASIPINEPGRSTSLLPCVHTSEYVYI